MYRNICLSCSHQAKNEAKNQEFSTVKYLLAKIINQEFSQKNKRGQELYFFEDKLIFQFMESVACTWMARSTVFKTGCRHFWEWSNLVMNYRYVLYIFCTPFWRVWCRTQLSPTERERPPWKWCSDISTALLTWLIRPYSASLLTSNTFFIEVVMNWEMVGRSEINRAITELSSSSKGGPKNSEKHSLSVDLIDGSS